jgi:hypothetical protein
MTSAILSSCCVLRWSVRVVIQCTKQSRVGTAGAATAVVCGPRLAVKSASCSVCCIPAHLLAVPNKRFLPTPDAVVL